MSMTYSGIQSRPGTYALLLSSAADAVIQIGRLGDLRLQPGYYVYVGSALGPGGVRGRLGHHMRPANRTHWHIDYLRAKTILEAVWFCDNRKSREHDWAKRFAAMPGASVPMAGFGASDCDCESHLFYFEECPGKGFPLRTTGLVHCCFFA
jgi:Uri superfamily endonuclease